MTPKSARIPSLTGSAAAPRRRGLSTRADRTPTPLRPTVYCPPTRVEACLADAQRKDRLP